LRFHPDKCKVLSIIGKRNNKQNVLKSKYLNDLLIIPTIWFALFTCV
jgi:hypothetical protein